MSLTPEHQPEELVARLHNGLTKRATLSKNDFQVDSVTPAETNSMDTSLLTPPLSQSPDTRRPFKPHDDDHVSLTMKKHHRQHRSRMKRAERSADSEVLNTPTPSSSIPALRASQSLPNISLYSQPTSSAGRGSLPASGSPRSRRLADSPREGLPRRPRRWTMPVKSTVTHAVTVTNPTIVAPPKRDLPPQTPAMISLRRATTSDPRRSDVYTSFPEPTFWHRRGSFLGKVWPQSGPNRQGAARRVSEPSRGVSIANDEVRPSISAVVPPVCTELQVENMEKDNGPVRRLSARYVSRASVYEIIWDENLSDSSGSHMSCLHSDQQTRRADRPQAVESDRRASLAMCKLETQLHDAERQSRKASAVAPNDDSVNLFSHFDLVRSLKRFSFANATDIGHLQELPRSRASTFAHTRTMSLAPANTIQSDYSGYYSLTSEPAIEFFPPLTNRPMTRLSIGEIPATIPESPVDEMVRAERSNWDLEDDIAVLSDVEVRTPIRPPGALVLSSSHARRHSSKQWKDRLIRFSDATGSRWVTKHHSEDLGSSRRRTSAGLRNEEAEPLLGPPQGCQT